MAPFQYLPLANPDTDIRLVVLLPGAPQDDLQCRIVHTSLVPVPAKCPPERMSLAEFQETLPNGWTAYQNGDGSVYFRNPEGSTTLKHPNPLAPASRRGQKMSIRQLHTTLPDADEGREYPERWDVRETFEGRTFFTRTCSTLWEHPTTGFDSGHYVTNLGEIYDTVECLYEAVSYVWGSQIGTDVVYEVGTPSDRTGVSRTIDSMATFEIGTNLAVALRHLRHPSDERTLFVDALCINQSDAEEKSLQIRRMRDVFHLASRVVAFLGEADSDSQLAISTLHSLGSQVIVATNGFVAGSPEISCSKRIHHSTMDLPYDDRTWKSIKTLLDRPWFHRLWMVQEIHLANHRAILQSGTDEIEWSCLRRAIVCLYCKDRKSPFLDHSSLANSYLRVRRLGDFDFAGLLGQKAGIPCSNPLDHVYGLLAFASPCLIAAIRPHYSKSVLTAYRDTALALGKETRRIDFLAACSRGSSMADAPSWVPNWSESVVKLAAPCQSCAGLSQSDAIYLDPDILQVSGVQVGTVLSVGRIAPSAMSEYQAFFQELSIEHCHQDPYVTGGTEKDAFIQTMCSTFMSMAHYKEITKVLLPIFTRSSSEQDLNSRHYYHVYSMFEGNRFATTREGYFGIFAPGTRPGDIAVVFLGCSVPILLRPSEDKACFRVIGTCLVAAWFNAAMLLGPLPPGVEVQRGYSEQGRIHNNFVGSNTCQNAEANGAGNMTQEDPRLGAYSPGWKRIPNGKMTVDDPYHFARFVNEETGETMNSDPRMLPAALKERGVDLKTFDLI